MTATETLSYLSSMYGRKTALTADDKLFIEQLYTQIMQKPFVRRAGCADCYKDALIELQIKIRTSGMEKQQYKLLNGALLFDHDSGQYYTNANLTDQIAKDYLKLHPEEARLFATIPNEPADDEPIEDAEDSIDEVIENLEPTKTESAPTEPVEEATIPNEPADDEPKSARKPRAKK